ncbi:LysR family transcriptional regulator [Oharaeibacter diazotrophicus]|uniref:DNA-binding transcriptional LysR family regulator n=1 Tax=Oharaeibacter diazotrophicus TaxID=1920512 RepID=A0A4R6R9Q0_9HYPH|nr:LysR family transcriptional regulator [Oharaeibacter diazotrophicus]TDP82793.1 DNA-binding transcriptional LysR family regulator [Oharaeibacter diazotrophicus]BBE72445.1 hydrogen peroxide-inducible genes activator [Pleomorphomonas sp. SM30]GLS76476.1 LysR family transcriptional regulator [Oharaeibacter diazotrophicus]
MDIRQLQYLSALAREKHFTRAAQACNVTQPTLSERIRQLEEELGVAIVERGQRFHGFTAEGERVLKWAQVILDNWSAMRQEIGQLREGEGQLGGRLTIGVIPSALPIAARLSKILRATYGNVDLVVLSGTSIEILRGLEDFSIDVGLTYLDNEPINGLVARPVYRERYCLFVRGDDPLARLKSVGWAEAASHPLALLTPNMQNRRIIDRAFTAVGARPIIKVETNSLMNLCANVRETGLASIMPEYIQQTLGPGSDLVPIPIDTPDVQHAVGLVALDRSPMPPLVTIALEMAVRLGDDLKSTTLGI